MRGIWMADGLLAIIVCRRVCLLSRGSAQQAWLSAEKAVGYRFAIYLSTAPGNIIFLCTEYLAFEFWQLRAVGLTERMRLSMHAGHLSRLETSIQRQQSVGEGVINVVTSCSVKVFGKPLVNILSLLIMMITVITVSELTLLMFNVRLPSCSCYSLTC